MCLRMFSSPTADTFRKKYWNFARNSLRRLRMDRFRANRTLRSRNARELRRSRRSLRAASSSNARNALSTIARGTFPTPPTSSKLTSSHWPLLVTGSARSTILSRQNLNQNIAGIHGTDIFGQPENPLDQAETKPGEAVVTARKSGCHRPMVCKAVVTAWYARRWSPPKENNKGGGHRLMVCKKRWSPLENEPQRTSIGETPRAAISERDRPWRLVVQLGVGGTPRPNARRDRHCHFRRALSMGNFILRLASRAAS